MSGRSALGRRNAYLALAISLLAATFLFYPSQEGMQWLMWRDTPVLAGALALAAAWFAWRWWQSPRS